MGGVCESKKNDEEPKKAVKIKTEDLSLKEIKYYEYDCPINVKELDNHHIRIQNKINQNFGEYKEIISDRIKLTYQAYRNNDVNLFGNDIK